MLSATDTCVDYKRFPEEMIPGIKTLQETYEKIAMALEPRQFPTECGIKEIYRKSPERKQLQSYNRQAMRAHAIRIRNNLFIKKAIKKCFTSKGKIYFKTKISELWGSDGKR